MNGWRRGATTALLAAAMAASLGCKKDEAAPAGKGPGGRQAQAFPVQVEPVEVRRVEYEVGAVGSVEAFEQVQITARVAGAVERVRFAEGDRVEKGAVLVEIEPERYRLAMESAKAAMQRAQATLEDAEASVQRREAVEKKSPGLIREEELATARARLRIAQADVSQARAALGLAELNLRDAFVRAGVPGVIQTRTVQTGQYVQPGAVLATLIRREPLLLRFDVPEQDAQRLSQGMPVTFRVRGASADSRARVVSVGEAANAASRMVRVLAHVDDDPAQSLRPGAFAEVRVPVEGGGDAPVIPQTAVRPSERGFLAFVVDGEVARERVLQLGMRTADGKVEVRDGLRGGERLVVRGAEALKDGAKVREDKPVARSPVGSPEPGAEPVKARSPEASP